MILLAIVVILLAVAKQALCLQQLVPKAVVSSLNSSLTLLYQNNLNLTDDVNHIGAILLDPMPRSSATAACAAIGESLLSRQAIVNHYSDFLRALSYQAYAGRAKTVQLYTIEGGSLSVAADIGEMTFPCTPKTASLPVLCSQSAAGNRATSGIASTPANQITVAAAGNNYVGFRNQKAFRFLGLRYAEPPQRWRYTSLYGETGLTIQANNYGSQCIQTGSGGSEDCLYLNIQTPYIPKAGSTDNLRAVLIWIHGGGFTGGSGADPSTDGSQLASRDDIVTVTFNYRLSTIGFLAVPGTNITGNYGIADQNLAIRWVVKNIANFGGDPNQITIYGSSAGAGSVRVHLGSPESIGLFQGAISSSNLGGGIDIGLGGDYATQYSFYPTIQGSYDLASELFSEAGCMQTDPDAAVTCLANVSANTLQNLPTVARYVVQDGKYVNTPELIVTSRNPNTAYVPILFGINENDGASFSTYPRPPVANETAGIMAALGVTKDWAEQIIASGLFPYYDTNNITLDSFNVSQRVATDNQFRCIDQASAYAGGVTGTFPAAYYYQSDRTDGGYDPNNLGGPPVTPGYPFGNPNLPYFRVHGADQVLQFGWFYPLRDADDLYNAQLYLSYFASFMRTGNPNPPAAYLQVRGYDKPLQAIEETGPWEKISSVNGPIRLLDWPAVASDFIDKPQCAWLNYSINFFLQQ